MFGLLARSYRHILARLDGERVDLPTLLILAIERSNELLLARFNPPSPVVGARQ